MKEGGRTNSVCLSRPWALSARIITRSHYLDYHGLSRAAAAAAAAAALLPQAYLFALGCVLLSSSPTQEAIATIESTLGCKHAHSQGRASTQRGGCVLIKGRCSLSCHRCSMRACSPKTAPPKTKCVNTHTHTLSLSLSFYVYIYMYIDCCKGALVPIRKLHTHKPKVKNRGKALSGPPPKAKETTATKALSLFFLLAKRIKKKPWQHHQGNDETRQDKTRQDKTKQNKTKQNKTKQNSG